jgi:hypothetical protein
MFSKNFGEFFFGCTEMKRIERREGDLASSQPWFVAHETSLHPLPWSMAHETIFPCLRGTRNNFLYCKLALAGSSGRDAF